MKHILSFTITARIWFEKVNGNSYYTTKSYVTYTSDDGEYRLAMIPTAIQYGYGSQYKYTAFEVVARYFGYDLDNLKTWTEKNPSCYFCEDALYVPRKKLLYD